MRRCGFKATPPLNKMQALRDTRTANARVPAASLVRCVTRSNSSQQRYVRSAQNFNPQPWLAERDIGASARSPKRVAMVFQAGPRGCPGRYLALMALKKGECDVVQQL